jgi:phage terminase small subunit
MPGRKPKPTKLKELLGNPGGRDLNLAEPAPEGKPQKPKFLKGRAAKIWDEYAPQLTAMGVLTSVDSHTFAAWCCLAAEFERAPDRMQAARIAQMRALAAAFGLEASARSRLTTSDGKPNKEDPADKYFDVPRSGNTLCN